MTAVDLSGLATEGSTGHRKRYPGRSEARTRRYELK